MAMLLATGPTSGAIAHGAFPGLAVGRSRPAAFFYAPALVAALFYVIFAKLPPLLSSRFTKVYLVLLFVLTYVNFWVIMVLQQPIVWLPSSPK